VGLLVRPVLEVVPLGLDARAQVVKPGSEAARLVRPALEVVRQGLDALAQVVKPESEAARLDRPELEVAQRARLAPVAERRAVRLARVGMVPPGAQRQRVQAPSLERRAHHKQALPATGDAKASLVVAHHRRVAPPAGEAEAAACLAEEAEADPAADGEGRTASRLLTN